MRKQQSANELIVFNRLNLLLVDYFFLYETNKLSLTNNFKTNKK